MLIHHPFLPFSFVLLFLGMVFDKFVEWADTVFLEDG